LQKERNGAVDECNQQLAVEQLVSTLFGTEGCQEEVLKDIVLKEITEELRVLGDLLLNPFWLWPTATLGTSVV